MSFLHFTSQTQQTFSHSVISTCAKKCFRATCRLVFFLIENLFLRNFLLNTYIVKNSPALQQLHFVYFLIRNCLTIAFFALGPAVVQFVACCATGRLQQCLRDIFLCSPGKIYDLICCCCIGNGKKEARICLFIFPHILSWDSYFYRCIPPRPPFLLPPCSTPKITHPTSNTQHPTPNITHSTSHAQHHTPNVTHPTSHTKHSISHISTSRTQHHTFHIAHTTSHTQHHTRATSHTQRHTPNITQHHTPNITHPTSHIQHRTSNIPHTQHHTPNITHSTSHIQHHSLDITLSTSHTQHHTLNMTHSTSHTQPHTF